MIYLFDSIYFQLVNVDNTRATNVQQSSPQAILPQILFFYIS